MTPSDAPPWAVCTIVVPLALSIAAFVAGRRLRTLLGVAGALASAWASAGLARQVFQQGSLRYAVGGWPVPLGIQLRADGLSALMLLLTAAVGLATIFYAVAYFSPPHSRRKSGAEASGDTLFWPLSLLLWASLAAMFLSADVFNLYVALELMTMVSVALVAMEGSGTALRAALRYLVLAMLGSLAYLLGVALLYSAYAVLDLDGLARVLQPGPVGWAAAALMTVGLMVKSALFPLHVWLPPAHAAAPSPVSALLSALVVKAPFYLLLRLWFEPFAGVLSHEAGHVLGALGAAAIVWGALRAFFVPRLKQMIAYSTVSQIGYLFLLFPLALTPARTLALTGAVCFALAHGLAKAALFLVAGTVLRCEGHDRIRELHGLGARMPATLTAYVLASISLVGLPPAGAFAGKWMLLSAGIQAGQWWYAAVILAGGPLAAAYLLRLVYYALALAPQADAPAPGARWLLDLPALAIALAAAGVSFAAGPLLRYFEAGGMR